MNTGMYLIRIINAVQFPLVITVPGRKFLTEQEKNPKNQQILVIKIHWKCWSTI